MTQCNNEYVQCLHDIFERRIHDAGIYNCTIISHNIMMSMYNIYMIDPGAGFTTYDVSAWTDLTSARFEVSPTYSHGTRSRSKIMMSESWCQCRGDSYLRLSSRALRRPPVIITTCVASSGPIYVCNHATGHVGNLWTDHVGNPWTDHVGNLWTGQCLWTSTRPVRQAQLWKEK